MEVRFDTKFTLVVRTNNKTRPLASRRYMMIREKHMHRFFSYDFLAAFPSTKIIMVLKRKRKKKNPKNKKIKELFGYYF